MARAVADAFEHKEHLLAEAGTPAEAAPWLQGRLGLWLCAAPRRDIAGQPYDLHAPLHALTAADLARVREWLGAAGTAPLVLDAMFADQDGEYIDALALEPAKDNQA